MIEESIRAGGDSYVYSLSPDENPSEAVIAVVAAVTDQPPLDLEFLTETINPDALNRLFDTTDENASSLTVIFEYSGCQVTTTSDEVQVESVYDC